MPAATKTVKLTLDMFMEEIRNNNGKDDESLLKRFKELTRRKKDEKTTTTTTDKVKRVAPYYLFCFEKRPEVMEEISSDPENSELAQKDIFGKISKRLGELWKECKELDEYQVDSEWYIETLALKEEQKKQIKPKPSTKKPTKKASIEEIEEATTEEEDNTEEADNKKKKAPKPSAKKPTKKGKKSPPTEEIEEATTEEEDNTDDNTDDKTEETPVSKALPEPEYSSEEEDH